MAIPVSNSVTTSVRPPARATAYTSSVAPKPPRNASSATPPPEADIPNTMAVEAPKAAPEETPTTPGSAKGFPKTACISAPATASAAPTAKAITIRGKRTTWRVDSITGSAGAQEFAIPIHFSSEPTTSLGEIASCPVIAETMTAATRISPKAVDKIMVRKRTLDCVNCVSLTELDKTIRRWQIFLVPRLSLCPAPGA